MTDYWTQIKARLEAQAGKWYQVGRVVLCEVNPDDIRAALGRVEELERELADTKKHLNYYMGRTAQAEAKLARVVEVLERCQCNTGECPCVDLALAAAKGE